MNDNSEPFFGTRSKILVGSVIMLFVLWLWMSWLQGAFPFSSGGTVTTSEKIEQQLSEKDVLDSLASSAASSTVPSPSVLKSLTSSPAKKNEKPIDSAVLESLTSTE